METAGGAGVSPGPARTAGVDQTGSTSVVLAVRQAGLRCQPPLPGLTEAAILEHPFIGKAGTLKQMSRNTISRLRYGPNLHLRVMVTSNAHQRIHHAGTEALAFMTVQHTANNFNIFILIRRTAESAESNRRMITNRKKTDPGHLKTALFVVPLVMRTKPTHGRIIHGHLFFRRTGNTNNHQSYHYRIQAVLQASRSH